MAEPVLDQPCVVAGVGQGIAAGVAKHVGVDPKRQLGAHANGLHEAVDGVSRKWTGANSKPFRDREREAELKKWGQRVLPTPEGRARSGNPMLGRVLINRRFCGRSSINVRFARKASELLALPRIDATCQKGTFAAA
jgi:hypothetical protein